MEENEFLKSALAAQKRYAGRTGLETLQAVIKEGALYPYGELLKMKLVGVGDGWADLEAEPSYQFYNPAMRLHGGYLASLMDSCLGSAVVSKLPAGQGLGTVQLSVNYVRKVDVQSGLLHVHATALHSGRTMLTAEGQLKDAKGRLCVHATGTFLVYPK